MWEKLTFEKEEEQIFERVAKKLGCGLDELEFVGSENDNYELYYEVNDEVVWSEMFYEIDRPEAMWREFLLEGKYRDESIVGHTSIDTGGTVSAIIRKIT